jgi:uroporphyrinogen-III synthase
MSETTVNAHPDRLTKVSSILVSQARPTDEKSPYFELAKRYNIKVDFRPFIEIQGVSFKDFRSKNQHSRPYGHYFYKP